VKPRLILKHNGKLLLGIALFGLPLSVLSLVSGLNASVAAVLFVVVVAGAVGLLRVLARGRVDWSQRVPRPRAIGAAVLSMLVVALLIQAVPYGRSNDNPPVVAEPAWDSPRTRELTVKACFDCHSNEVDYPWYSDIAPVSWAVQSHVDKGRHDLNLSEWNRPQKEAHESAETVEDGSMPPWYYTLMRPNLLTDVEKQDLIRGLETTLGTEGRERDDGVESDEDDD
jgi:hypothetical protein